MVNAIKKNKTWRRLEGQGVEQVAIVNGTTGENHTENTWYLSKDLKGKRTIDISIWGGDFQRAETANAKIKARACLASLRNSEAACVAEV